MDHRFTSNLCSKMYVIKLFPEIIFFFSKNSCIGQYLNIWNINLIKFVKNLRFQWPKIYWKIEKMKIQPEGMESEAEKLYVAHEDFSVFLHSETGPWCLRSQIRSSISFCHYYNPQWPLRWSCDWPLGIWGRNWGHFCSLGYHILAQLWHHPPHQEFLRLRIWKDKE